MWRAPAIWRRISAEGLRMPRSIWLRYGFEMPAISESLRSESWPTRRCSRMNSPRSRQRSSISVIPQRYGVGRARPNRRPAGGSVGVAQQGVDRRLTGAVAAGELALQRVDAGVVLVALGRDPPLELAELVEELGQLVVAE